MQYKTLSDRTPSQEPKVVALAVTKSALSPSVVAAYGFSAFALAYLLISLAAK